MLSKCQTRVWDAPCDGDNFGGRQLSQKIEKVLLAGAPRYGQYLAYLGYQLREHTNVGGLALARHRSSVETETPSSCEIPVIAALSGGSNRATASSLNACPY